MMTIALSATSFPFLVIQLEIELLVDLSAEEFLREAMTLHLEIQYLCKILTNGMKNGTIFTIFQVAVASVGLLQLGYSDASLALWIPLNAIISIVGWFYWMLHCTLTNVKYKKLNDFTCMKMYTSAQQARAASEAARNNVGDNKDAYGALAYSQNFKLHQLEAIRGLDKDVATLMGIPLSTRLVGQLTLEVCVVLILAFNLLSSKLHHVGLSML